ncbi:pyruvate dehydrogenase E1 component, alpha subunit [Aeromicrobium marinum DSM 15272]|uniref:2-oxoisovalerate dehydrogenase subunit alpha n=1 Tax=Aeromicrobium marinum DSM 15272 TaxID=585531 RepID=E2SFD4_9ACTN|nr:thiamine pyrophosphate-dependent dehydrogenase E1 component subunit alpha [Aeromicrobium marinum]EFQ82035.1 pyruvate dehydrogenase E1 component, alpha subunit [Aeromicrobium marinum DSM 15272]
MTAPVHHPTGPEPVQLLTPEGIRTDHPDHVFDGDTAAVAALYRDLVLVRRVDTEAYALQRHGELGLWPPSLGQEACQVGSARALRRQDFAFPTYRDHGVAWSRGVPPEKLLGLYRGVSLGGWDPADHGYALPAIIIGAQTLHAAGYAMGVTFDGDVGTGDPDRDTAVIAYLGDGATSQGDVNEALDWAAVFGLPVVFLIENNQYAISSPVARQSAVPLAQRAEGFGLPGVRVDGNDVLACHAVTSAALTRARDGEGATLIEAVTYRMGAHTTSDDPGRYREAAETEEWSARDPLLRVRRHLESVDWPESFFDDLDTEADDLGERLRAACRALPEPDLATLFDRVHVDPDPTLAAQREEYVAWRAGFDGSAA